MLPHGPPRFTPYFLQGQAESIPNASAGNVFHSITCSRFPITLRKASA
jgi:hypothetical protein